MYSLLLLSSLVHVTTCIVYTVTPDDHYYPNTTCHHCHNLQHYQLNITKYFTSNTQLLFLPGLHHLHTDLIIQNVHNISLIGSTDNGTAIVSNNLSTISIINSFELTIKHIKIVTRHKLLYTQKWRPMTIKDCSFVLLYHLHVYQLRKLELNEVALLAINMMGNSYFRFVQCYYGRIQLFYNETHTEQKHNNLSIKSCTVKTIDIMMIQSSYRVTSRIINIQVHHEIYENVPFILAKALGTNKMFIVNCELDSNIYGNNLFVFSSVNNSSVQFTNCKFMNNNMHIDYVQRGALIQLYGSVNLEINDCNFHGNSEEHLLSQRAVQNVNSLFIIIKNTNFTGVKGPTLFNMFYIDLIHAKLILIGSVKIHNIATFSSIIFLMRTSTMIISGTVNFSHNHVNELIKFYSTSAQYIIIKQNSILNIESIQSNHIVSFFDTDLSTVTNYIYPFCIFQYFASSAEQLQEKKSFQITFYNNHCKFGNCYNNIPAINCVWLKNSLFYNYMPLEVNDRYIHFINSSGKYKLQQVIEHSSLCVCTTELNYDCHINDL